ncbi:helix-turn-helix domain-containing protein [Sporomusa aerivorans]|uniref:helix-turn-helix domain-containing protein n=1 Tax=Sporomusa aerivorans TaxID=204936 RepID=UPI00352B7EBE
MIIFAERLKELRMKHKVSQAVLADLLHVSQRQISYYETAQDTPSLPSLIAIADYFDISLDYLVGRSNNPGRQ